MSATPPPIPPPISDYPPPPPPPPQQQPEAQSTAGRTVAIVVVCILAIAGGIWLWQSKFSPRARFAAESAEDREAGIRAAFHGTGTPVSLTTPEAKAIDALFQRMLAAIKKKDAEALGDCFDAAAMMEVAADQNPATELKGAARILRKNPAQRRKISTDAMRTIAETANHESCTIRRLEIDKEGKQAVAWVVWRDAESTFSKERYWLLLDGGWKAYDLEELDTGIRMSTSAAAAASMPGSAMASGKKAMADFQDLAMAIRSGEVEKARKLMPAVRKSVLNKVFPEVLDVLEANVLMMEEKLDDSIRLLERLEKRRPDMPVVHYLKATAYSHQKKHGEVIAAAGRYIDFLGEDRDMLNLMANAHAELKQPDKAKALALRTLAMEPDDGEAMILFASHAAAGDAATLDSLLKKSADAPALLSLLAENIDYDSDAFPVIAAAARRAAPEAEATQEFNTILRSRDVWKEAGEDNDRSAARLVEIFREGEEEAYDALCDALQDYRYDAGDAAGLERLAKAARAARPDSSPPLQFEADLRALQLRGEMGDKPDPAALKSALENAELPGSLAWRLFTHWSSSDNAAAAALTAAALKEVKPEDPMNAVLSGQMESEEEEAPAPEDTPKTD